MILGRLGGDADGGDEVARVSGRGQGSGAARGPVNWTLVEIAFVVMRALVNEKKTFYQVGNAKKKINLITSV